MARKMVDVMGRMFARLRSKMSESEWKDYAVDLAAARYVTGGEPEEDALKRAVIVTARGTGGQSLLAVLRWRGQYYFALPPLTQVAIGPGEDVEEEVRNAGLSCLLFESEHCPVVGDAAVIVESVFGRSGAYELAEVEPLFARHRLYRSTQAFDGRSGSEMWSRCLALAAKGMPAMDLPPWLQNMRQEFIACCEDPGCAFIGEMLMAAASAGSWGHTYLEVFRATEALLKAMLVEDLVLRHRVLAQVPRVKLVANLDEALLWRFREDDALGRLAGRLDAAVQARIAQLLGVADIDKAIRRLYATRNRTAHGSLLGGAGPEEDTHLRAALLLMREAYLRVTLSPRWSW